MTLAIDYDIAHDPARPDQVYGLGVAIFEWLKAFFRYGSQEQITFLVDNSAAWNEVQKLAAEAGLDPQRLKAFDRRFVQENYGGLTTVFRPDPAAKEILWRRETVKGLGFNFCGLAHAISGLEAGAVLEQYCLAPSERSDAIICPSHAVKSAIQNFFDMYGDYLGLRFGTTYRCPVQLPVIPLGIEVETFMAKGDPGKRVRQRASLGVGEDEFVLLWVGRLSHAIKAHPLAMFQAAERAAQQSLLEGGRRVHLVMQGYFVPEDYGPHFEALAKEICKDAKVTFIPTKDPRFPDELWAAGDALLSLIDNMQESFGLTPIEAMAAGLPRIVSDWDGYRDSVEHGVDGFLIPTYQPPAGQGKALAELLLSGKEIYGGYLAKTALSVAVDHVAAAEAILTLMRDEGLRREMAARALSKARAQYDWRTVIPRYEAFWAEMAEQRRADHMGKAPLPWPAVPPQAPDPFSMYAGYPTAALSPGGMLRVAVPADTVRALWKYEMNVFGLDMMIKPHDTMELLKFIAKHGEASIADCLQHFTALDTAQLWRTVGWLVKLGVVGYRAE